MLGTHPLVRFLNQNRREIRNVILVILVFFLVLRLLNNMEEKKVEREITENNKIQTELSLIDEHKVAIEDFLEFCKNGDESSAYALLSSECKEQSFKTLNDFRNKYISKYFLTNKSYTITYKSNINGEYNYSVKIFEDILSTGKIDSSYVIQNFIIVQEDNTDKIKININ